MAKQLLPLCSIEKPTTRDGWAGSLARLFLPFYSAGYWYPSGQTISFPRSTIPQDQSVTFNGRTKADTFVKSYGVCLKG